MVTVLLTLMAVILLSCSAADNSDNSNDSEPIIRQPGTGLSVVTNAEVYTVDSGGSGDGWAEAFAYDHDGIIVAVGSSDEVLVAAGDDPTVIDVGGRLVLPGFQDPHVHVPEAGVNLDLCFLPPGLDVEDYEDLAADCADQQPGDGWVRAAGPSLFEFRDGETLPIDVLDRAIPDRPALILDDLGHAVWTNSAGLAATGITADDPDPQGGVLHRHPDSGRLTGLLLEDAQQLVRNAAADDDDVIYEGLLVAMEELAANGITSVSDAGGYWAQNHPAAWQRAEAEGTLTVRAANSLYLYPDLDLETQLAEFERRFRNDSDMLRFDTAKVYVDGILDLGTAAMIDPYDRPVDPRHPSGFNYFRPDDLRRYVDELHRIGYRVNFHAIGDAAVRQALDSVEAIDDSPAATADRRHRITHTYLVAPDDLPRFRQLGVVADLQQSAAAVDTGYHEFLSEFIGDRAFDLIPTAALLDAGATVTLSSDWDADALPPLGTIERALTREANAVSDLETAIALSTIEAAYALGHDDTTGSISVGKFADFVILDRNIFELETDRLDEASVVSTYVGGRLVHDRGETEG